MSMMMFFLRSIALRVVMLLAVVFVIVLFTIKVSPDVWIVVAYVGSAVLLIAGFAALLYLRD
ncbi:MAG: hypothetical protein V1725_07505 [archaeon]